MVATAAWLSFRPADGPSERAPDGGGAHASDPGPDDGNGPVAPPNGVPPSNVARVPEPEDLTLRTIEMLIAEKETERAIRALEPHLEKDDADPKAYRLRGRAFLDTGSWRLAERDFASAMEGEGEKPTTDTLDGRAEALVHLRKTTEARKLLDRSAELAPDRARLHALRALSHLKDDDTGAARKELERALSLDPSDPLANGLSKRLDNVPR